MLGNGINSAQKNGVAVIQEVVNLHLLGGHIGRIGAGLCPVRGHSNVQEIELLVYGKHLVTHLLKEWKLV